MRDLIFHIQKISNAAYSYIFLCCTLPFLVFFNYAGILDWIGVVEAYVQFSNHARTYFVKWIMNQLLWGGRINIFNFHHYFETTTYEYTCWVISIVLAIWYETSNGNFLFFSLEATTRKHFSHLKKRND